MPSVEEAQKNNGRLSHPQGNSIKFCYPNIPAILKSQYKLKDDDRIMVYVMKQITLPNYCNYRTKFKNVYHGTLKDYKAYLREFMRQRQGRKKDTGWVLL